MKKILSKIVFAAVATFATAPLFAQGPLTDIDLLVKHSDGIYKKGEKVEIEAVLKNNVGDLTLSVLINGAAEVDAEPITLKVGKKTKIFSRSFSEPASVKLTVALADDKKKYATVGALVAPEEFRPGFEEPSDFMAFWADQVAAMRASEMKVVLTPYEMPDDMVKYRTRVEAYDLEISMHEGNPVRAYIAWPKNVDPKSCAILICPHGSGVRSSSAQNAIFRAHSNNCIAIDINAHGILNNQSKEFYDSLNNGELKDYRTLKLSCREDVYFRLMYLRMQRVLDYATSLELWDGRRVALDGTSQGGGQALALAGLDSRVGYAVIQVPALTDIGGTASGHRGGWPYRGKFKEKRDGDYSSWLPYYDCANFARHITDCQIFFEAGVADVTCPPECVYSTFNVCPAQVKSITTNAYREHSQKLLNEENYDQWKTAVDTPRRNALKSYLK